MMMRRRFQENRPIVSLFLILITTIIFFLQFLLPFDEFAFVPATAFENPWTFITSIFLHASPAHLFANMFALFIFGTYLENRIYRSQFISLYFLAGIIGNLGYMLTASNQFTPGVGASGAIYGIMGASAILTPTAMVWVAGIPMPMIVAAVFWAVTEYLGFFVPSNIARGAHLGGLFLGLVVGIYLRSQFRRRTLF